MSIHRYPWHSLWPDYLRGAAGLLIGVGGWSLAPAAPHVIVIFGGLTVLFLLFTMRTIVRQRTRIEISEEGLSLGGRKHLYWNDVDHVRLRYYSTRRNRSGGWMTLTLGAGPARVAIDSQIDGFEAIAARSAQAVAENGVTTDDVTLANLAALGVNAAPAAAQAS